VRRVCLVGEDFLCKLPPPSNLTPPPRTWSPFFVRHGAFTPAQLAAIPPLLDGANVILCAATASGKTEAALAPLIERHLPPDRTASRLNAPVPAVPPAP
jgi:Lhr-like helicase